MATRLAMATNEKHGLKTPMYETDCAQDLLKEVAVLNREYGLTMADWKFTRRNYKGDDLGEYDWKNETVTVRLGDLFS